MARPRAGLLRLALWLLPLVATADRNVTVSAPNVDAISYTPDGAWIMTSDIRKAPDGSTANIAATQVDGATASLRFNGTAIYVNGWRATNQGVMRLAVDGSTPVSCDCWESVPRDVSLPLDIEILCGITGLPNKEHLVTYQRLLNDPRASIGGTTPSPSFGLAYQFLFTVPDAAAAPSSKPTGGGSSVDGTMIGAAAGGGIVALGLVGALVWWLRRRRRHGLTMQRRLSISTVHEGHWPGEQSITTPYKTPTSVAMLPYTDHMPSDDSVSSGSRSAGSPRGPLEIATSQVWRPFSMITDSSGSGGAPSETEILHARRTDAVPPLPNVRPPAVRRATSHTTASSDSRFQSGGAGIGEPSSGTGTGTSPGGQTATDTLESRLRALEESLALAAAPPLYSPPMPHEEDEFAPRTRVAPTPPPPPPVASGSRGEALPTRARDGIPEGAKGIWRP